MTVITNEQNATLPIWQVSNIFIDVKSGDFFISLHNILNLPSGKNVPKSGFTFCR